MEAEAVSEGRMTAEAAKARLRKTIEQAERLGFIRFVPLTLEDAKALVSDG